MKNFTQSIQTPPRIHDYVVRDIIERGLGYDAVLIAYELGLFSVLAKTSKDLKTLSTELKIAERPLKMLLQVNLALHLVEKTAGFYQLSPAGKDYFVEESPFFFGKLLEFAIETKQNLCTYENLKLAVLSNSPRVYGGENWAKKHETDLGRAKYFTSVMHTHSFAAANHWTKIVDLSRNRTLLDIGGGSGVHSIAAVSAFPQLEAIIFDLPTVCETAREYIQAQNLKRKIRLCGGDMWHDVFPLADAHFFSDVFHDWTPEKCLFLARKSFEALPPGGKIIIHEMLFDEKQHDSLTVASASLSMLLWTEGQQFTGEELREILTESGFASIKIDASFGYWSIIEGRKP